MMETTKEDIARVYSSAMDSVNLINNGKPKMMSDDEWDKMVSNNIEHLKIVVSKDFWTDENLTPFTEAIGWVDADLEKT